MVLNHALAWAVQASTNKMQFSPSSRFLIVIISAARFSADNPPPNTITAKLVKVLYPGGFIIRGGGGLTIHRRVYPKKAVNNRLKSDG